MKAAQISDYGSADTVKIVEIDQPEAKDGQVLVDVRASSLNPFDTTIREGYMREFMPVKFPIVLGGDIAGVVIAVASDVSGVKVGDKVYGQAHAIAGNSGAFAEFATTKATQVAKLPSNLNCEQSARMPLIGVSALQAITEHIGLKSGHKMFIHGGAGGIGAIAIQIAKHIGAYVATTASGDGIDYVKKLGADEVIDYKTQDFAELIHDFDAVFETAGGKEFDKTLDVLKDGGVAVSMISKADEAKVTERKITAITQSTQVNTERLNKLTELIETGVVTPNIGKVFPLSEVSEAFKAREGGVLGKVILKIK